MANKNRDDFLPKTRTKIANLAGWLCSYPGCRAHTVGATSDGEDKIDIGTAAHICAAAPGGPRYDAKMSPEDRASAKNGIWMCRDHGKAIDSKDPKFTVERLREWKKQAELESWQRVMRDESAGVVTVTIDAPLLKHIRAAAEADLEIFKRSAKWPQTSIALTLKVDGFDEPITTNALAVAVTSLDDLILVAQPGMGKTTTLFQIAEGLLANGNGTPLVVPLGDWATEGRTILDSILKRHTFNGVTEGDIRKAATCPGVVLLLDGWNELDDEARKRARVQVTNLKAELPELGLVISTRRQSLDVPFGGTKVELLPLNEEQQMQIAVKKRGDAGARIVDQAWRTAGVRELVTIPLYLTALLSLPEGAPFPTTKEEVLRHFVAAHEKEASHAEALHAIAHGFQQDYLERLAVFATRTTNTAIVDNNARRLISETEALLADNGQITNKSQPNEVLDVLVSNHVLMRAGDMPGYSFQHQQFQEWYASYSVERRIVAEVDDPKGRETLKGEVLNLPVWEEAILFAVERLARGNAHQQVACGKAILAAFEVDPILAAEMIYRSTEEVWAEIAVTIQAQVTRWHAPGKVDRALRFMLTSGRSEFLNAVWPLITNHDQQIRLKALRNCRRFSSSILGNEAVQKIRALSRDVRNSLLCEIASHSGIDGLDLVSTITKDDDNPELQVSVLEALAFRRADRHVALVFQNATEKIFDLLAHSSILDEVDDEHVKKGIAAARERQVADKASAYERLRVILYTHDNKDRNAELTDIVSSMEIENGRDAGVQLIYEAHKRYPRAVSDGLLARLRAGSTLFYGADDILASSGLSLEDDALLQLALAESSGRDNHAEAAASLLGPQSAGIMIDELLILKKRLCDASGKYDDAVTKRYHDIKSRVAHVSGASLVAAVQARSEQADNEQMSSLAELLSRNPDDNANHGRLFDTESLDAIRKLIEDFGNRMLASRDAERRHLASIAVLASCAPDVSLLPLLKRMLDDNLRRYRAFREEAAAKGWQPGKAKDEASWPLTHEYQNAFLAIDAPKTAVLMREYLDDPHFGVLAAQVLVSQWMDHNEPSPNKRFFGGVDFSRVSEKRALLATDPTATSEEAEIIFAAIEPLIKDDASEDQKKHAAELGILAVRLPHGQRDATINKLIALTPCRGRIKIFLNLILSGVEIDSRLITDVLAETLQAAKTETWIISQNEGYELRHLLQLFPFTNQPVDVLEAVRNLPDNFRQPYLLNDLVNALAQTPLQGGEDVLFKLAEENPSFFQDHQWRESTLKLGTPSAAHRLIELTANGKLPGSPNDDWYWSRALGLLLAKYPDERKYVYGLLRDEMMSKPLSLLARAVSENPDTEGLLLLVDIENNQKLSFVGWDTIENLVAEHVPDENWSGAYNVVSVPAIELRQKLLAKTTDGGSVDAAAHYLNSIDVIRDGHGVPVSEPRHPDLASGKPWPIMTPDTYAAMV